MDFENGVGKEIIELLKYWYNIGDDPKIRLSIILRGHPKFEKTTNMEKMAISSIKKRATAEQWKRLNELFVEGEKYITETNRRRMWEYNQLLEQKRLAQEEAIRNEELKRIKAAQEVEKLFEYDFLASKQIWSEKFSDLVSGDEFKELAAQFIIKWFEKQHWGKPDQEQAICIAEVWDDVQVIARAGSGKTSTIVNRAAFLVKHCGVSPSEILLLAFNREAAKEVNNRLHKLLGEKAPQAMTFHALAYALVHPEESIIYDDEDNGLRQSSTVQKVIDSFIRDTNWSERIQSFMIKYFRSSWEDLIHGGYHLDPEEMVEYRRNLPYIGLDGNYYKSKGEKIIADYLFEYDIPYIYEKNFWWKGLNYKPDFVIPLNTELKGIVIEYLGLAGDPQYDRQTEDKKKFWKEKSDYEFIELLPIEVCSTEILNKKVGTYLESCGYKMHRLNDIEIWHRIKDRAVDEFSSIISQFIGRCRKKLISPEILDNMLKSKKSLSNLQYDFLKVVVKIYQEYLQMLLMNGEEDFEGLLMRAEESIREGKSTWKRKVGSGDLRYIKYLFIDEYQDFSLLFYQLVSVIQNLNQNMKVFCVGDDWQAINGFAGSDLCYFKDFRNYFKEAKSLAISSNYRSCSKIIEVGNRLMQGNGTPAKAVINDLGDVQIVCIDDFKPNIQEAGIYNGDLITPILIRLVYYYTLKGQRVSLLCRRRNGLPWYTSYFGKGRFHDKFITAIRAALPEELRPMVIAMDTTHSYKGKEEDAIIIVDAVKHSYPLIHPSYVFFEVLGQTLNDIISEEQRLFYVALSRARKSLVIVTERNEESQFLDKISVHHNDLSAKWLNELPYPKRKCTHYIVSVENNNQRNGTYEIKSYLQENKYSWNSYKRAWIKHLSSKEFSKEKLLEESWAKKAKNIVITVIDEFGNKILEINFVNGVAFTKDFEKA